MSDELLPYYNRELAFIRRLGARVRRGPSEDRRPAAPGARRGRGSARRAADRGLRLPQRPHPPQARRRLPRDHRRHAGRALSALPGPDPVDGRRAVRARPRAGRLGRPATRSRATPMLETEPIDGEPCRFRTCYPDHALADRADGRQLDRPAVRRAAHAVTAPSAVAVLRIAVAVLRQGDDLRATGAWSRCGSSSRGRRSTSSRLYELLLNNTLGVALAASPTDREPVVLGPQLPPAGRLRARRRACCPTPTRSFLGYRLLTEYFAFPQKFLFFDLAGLGRQALQKAGNRLEIYLLPQPHQRRPGAERHGRHVPTRLHADRQPVPAAGRADRPDAHARRSTASCPTPGGPLAHEVYSIDRVTATSPDNEQVEYQPFYSFKHAADRREQKTFWHATRRPAGQRGRARRRRHRGLPVAGRSGLRPGRAGRLDARRGDHLPEPRPAPPAAVRRPGESAFRLTGGRAAVADRVPDRPADADAAARAEARGRLAADFAPVAEPSVAGRRRGGRRRPAGDPQALRLRRFGRDAVDDRRHSRACAAGGSWGACPATSAAGSAAASRSTVHFDEDRFSGSGVFLFASVLERFLGPVLLRSIRSPN